MSTSCSIPDLAAASLPLESQERWFAIRTRSRHEKVVANQLDNVGVTTFLPLLSEIRRWSDRQKRIEEPLFPGYAFVRIDPSAENRVRVLKIDGVAGFVGFGNRLVPVPETEIDAVRRILANGLGFSRYPFLRVGNRVRVRGGCLDGIEGVLVARNSEKTLIVSVDAVGKSIAINIETYDVEAL